MKVFSLQLCVFFFFQFDSVSASCRLNPKYEYYSLSSSVSLLLEELGIVNQLSGVSSFHPLKDKRVKRLAGGLFLSHRAFKSNSNKKKIVFFDQSIELRRNLSKVSNIEIIEVFTRGVGAFDAFDISVEISSSFLMGCERKISFIQKEVESIKKKMQKKEVKVMTLFYLGKFNKNKKDPEMIIVNDGFVKDLKKYSKLQTYKSSLEYVIWSSKELKKLPLLRTSFSISDEDVEGMIKTKISSQKFNIVFRGALSPGIGQVYLLRELIEKLN